MKDKIYPFLNERRYNNDSGEPCNLLELGEYSIGPLGIIFVSLFWYGVMASAIYYSNEKSLGGLEVKVESNEK